jgi:hypothetical protein
MRVGRDEKLILCLVESLSKKQVERSFMRRCNGKTDLIYVSRRVGKVPIYFIMRAVGG